MQVSEAARVLAVIVAHDGARWLPSVLESLRLQDWTDFTVVAVDNASHDGSREFLVDRLGTERVLVCDVDVGFGAAVSMALDACPDHIDYLWLLHDDVAFLPDALGNLVAALDEDPRLAAVGPKLRDWSDGERLQSVGWTIDMTGRADSGVDLGELDQGQRDADRRTLYVSTAGMLIRRDVLAELGRFDHRFHVFRDDLDLCWRAWLAGYEIEVVPAALGAHVAAASEHVRLGQTRQLGPRYFAERNTLAALLKNYGPARLPLVIVLYFIVGLAKVAGFVLTRRFADAWQTVRAWLWNGLHLRETLRLRRITQQLRRRTDTELKGLFGRITPRVRAYAEAIGYWISGGDTAPARPAAEPEEPTEALPGSRLVALARRRPVAVAGIVLVLAVIGGVWQLLAPGQLRGGDFAPWPESSLAFLANYIAGWNEAAAFGTSQVPSPVQALLGLLQLALGGSSYLAPRVLLFGTVAAAWIFALRAAQVYSQRRVPRVVAATAYVLSPPAIAALLSGQVGALVLLAVIPGLVAAGLTFGSAQATPVRAWRAVSAAVLLGAVGAAFEPAFLGAIVLGGIAVILLAITADAPAAWKRALLIRVTVTTAGPVVLLLPWSLELLTPTGPIFTASGDAAGGALWQWLALSPDLYGFPGLIAGAGFVLAGLLGLVLGVRHSPGLVGLMWAVAIVGALLGWWLGRAEAYVWPGTPLLLTAAAFAALYALAFARAEALLGSFGFGWRQVSAAVTVVAVTVSIGAVSAHLARSPLDAYVVNDPPLPAFITAAAAHGDEFRVLVMADGPQGLDWEVVTESGPSMAAMGVPSSGALDQVGALVEDIVSGRDPTAAGVLGRMGVRYVVVPEAGTSPALDQQLRAQFYLEPRPVASGRVYRIPGWLPRAAIIPVAAIDALEDDTVPPDDIDVVALTSIRPGELAGQAHVDGAVLLAEHDDRQWQVRADGRLVERMPSLEGITGAIVFGPIEAGQDVTIGHANDAPRAFVITGQVLLLLLIISLALRPPSFARRDDETVPAPTPQLDADRERARVAARVEAVGDGVQPPDADAGPRSAPSTSNDSDPSDDERDERHGRKEHDREPEERP